MARPPSSEIVRFGLARPPLPELLAPGAKTSMTRPPPGKVAENEELALAIKRYGVRRSVFREALDSGQEIAGQRERFDPELAARTDAAVRKADAFF